MTTEAEVRIWDMTVGYLIWDDRRRYADFEFDRRFISKDLDLSPLQIPHKNIELRKVYSFQPPSENDRLTFKGLPLFIADSLPDSFGNKVINAWLLQQGRHPDSFNPVEHLCYTGNRGLGALEFYPAMFKPDKIENVDITSLIELAQSVFASRQNWHTNIRKRTSAIRDIVRVGASAGGARPKAVIAYNESTKEIKSGQIAAIPKGFEHWLLKIDGVSESADLGLATGMGQVEYAYYLMAKDSGIDMAECRLLEEGGRAHFMTRRFDRPGNGEKLHMQSLCALANMNFTNINSYNYENVFAVLRTMRLPHTSIEQLYRRMIFNVLAKNCDDHTKNISFLMDKQGNWSLSPAFDVSYAYDPTGRWNYQHFLSINGKNGGINGNIFYPDLEKVGKEQGIKNRKEIIEQVCEVVSRWPEYAKTVGVDNDIAAGIGKTHEVQAIQQTKPALHVSRAISFPLDSKIIKSSALEQASKIPNRESSNTLKNKGLKLN